MKQKIALAFVSIMLAFSFTACGAETENKPTETVTVTASPETETPEFSPSPETESTLSDEEFAGLIRENTDAYDGSPTSSIIELTDAICSAFDRDVAFEDIGATLIESGAKPYDAGFMIGASVSYACPEYEELIGAYPNA